MKQSITCKDIQTYKINASKLDSYIPRAGDVAVFKVLSIGKHESIQSITGNNIYLFPGDEFMGVFGHRYATEQFEGYVPDKPTTQLDILGKGGVVGVLKSMHISFKDIGTTRVELVGYAEDENDQVINSIYYNKTKVNFDPNKKPKDLRIILSLGSSMDSGKTTSAAFLCRGISQNGKIVAYIKLTGTHYTKDSHFARDCGASIGIDFGHAGYPSTFMCSKDELLDLFQYLLEIVNKSNVDYVVMEIADGILQRETEMLLNDENFRKIVDGVLFSSVDSLSALHGYELLKSKNLKPFAISGVFTMSPLLIEEVKTRIDINVYDLDALQNIDVRAIQFLQ